LLQRKYEFNEVDPTLAEELEEVQDFGLLKSLGGEILFMVFFFC
jgi:hypothetical protein